MRLLLRRPERADLDVIVDWMGDNAFRLFLFGDSEAKTVPMGQQMMGVMSSALSSPIGAMGHLLIEDADSGPAGIVLVQELSWRNRTGFVAIYLAEPWRSPDGIEAAMRCVLTHCFDEMNLHRAGAKVEAGDTALASACERIGLSREFVWPRHVLRDGKAIDIYGYGILQAEFEHARGAGAAN